VQAVNWIALSLAIVTSFGLLLSRDWRWRLGFLAVQYISVFWMVQTHLPVSMAAAKLVTGWMACAVMGIAQRNVPTAVETQSALPQGRLFQFFLAGMILAVTFAGAEQATTWLGIDITVAWSSLLLIGLGLLHLGITSDAFRVTTSLLSILAGFEILYGVVETSILVTALLAVVNLGLALAGAFFVTTVQEEEA
jgi:hypothetical protein